MKILIIQKKFMGDVLVTSSILPLLKKKYPKSEISFLLEEKHAQILLGNPYIDHFIYFSSGPNKTLSDLKDYKFDLVIDLYSKIETAIISFFSGAKTRIGFFKKYTQFFYNHPVKRSIKVKSKNTTLGIEHRLQMLEPLGIPFQEVFPKVYIQEEELAKAIQILNKNGLSPNDNLVMISTFGSSDEKTYPVEYMVELLEYIAADKPSVKILCNFLPSQKELFESLYSKLSSETKNLVVKSFDTKNLREFAAVISLCKCLIGNEGGATNVSKSLDIPTFTIFSPHIRKSDWAWTSRPEVDKFLHVTDFIKDSKSYKDFKPSFLKADLQEFLDQTILTT
ncbi:glycosyltransferase family 9 protein [Chryseobacterium wangxinyae]|uniref:glycosyltransferase family 9 protein n=1 Tax=Chryseobacterium sp. CY353 TaxID=2997334 RepID=UPI0022700BFD|nr:glycosyltransferase family 9 protein [Chryseobacterium sp. CY353]MCY0970366.1 glycosyltransferase family 9 protein [Chryseobacterium sp. CY353]